MWELQTDSRGGLQAVYTDTGQRFSLKKSRYQTERLARSYGRGWLWNILCFFDLGPSKHSFLAYKKIKKKNSVLKAVFYSFITRLLNHSLCKYTDLLKIDICELFRRTR